MNLAIDIGNSRTKLGLFDGERMLARETWESWGLRELSAWATNQNVENVILSTVAGALDDAVLNYLRENFTFVYLDSNTPLPIVNRYRSPETLGKDRLAAVVGAFCLFPDATCLVIDAGSCITYDVLEAGGVFLGGNISPGMQMRLRAMHAFTARLPLLEVRSLEGWLGDSTESAMQCGAQTGTVLEIDGFIEYFKSRFGRVNVILTGGDAVFFAKKLKSEIFVNNHLVLMGLNKILTYNVERQV